MLRKTIGDVALRKDRRRRAFVARPGEAERIRDGLERHDLI